MSMDEISEPVENLTKEVNPLAAETKTARFSIGGLVAAVLTALFGILTSIGIASPKGPRFIAVFYALCFIGIAVIMAVRAFQPPMGWKKALATWFGSLLCGGAFIIIGVGTVAETLKGGNVMAGVVLAVPGFFLLRYGFKRFVSPVEDLPE